jgi:transcription termination factor Rho
MAVLQRSELEASPLADLHAIADQVGLDGFRRLRKADLIDAILARGGQADGAETRADEDEGDEEREESAARPRRRRATRTTRTPRRERAGGERAAGERGGSERGGGARGGGERGGGERGGGERGGSARGGGERGGSERGGGEQEAEGVVELLGNGSAFLRISPPEASDEDVYISAAQVRRCELVSGDRVSGPVRPRRTSERYPSLARVETINGESADAVAEGTRYEDLPVAYPRERLELDAQDPTLAAIEWLTPIGRGSRALIVGAARAGKTDVLRRVCGALSGREGLELVLVLSGVRPEEPTAWRERFPVLEPVAALDFAASADAQGQAVEHAVDTAKRVATRGGDVVVLIDSLDGLHPHAARKVLASARNLAEGGSLTVVATATRPFGGESTVIALDVALTSTGRQPAIDLAASGTVRPELLVGEDGAAAITKERAAAVDARRA